MASKRAVLETLKLRELLSLADTYEIALDNRRKKDVVLEALAKSRKASLANLLSQ